MHHDVHSRSATPQGDAGAGGLDLDEQFGQLTLLYPRVIPRLPLGQNV